MTYIGNDPQKNLFIIHHIACIYLLIFSILYEYEPKDLLVCIFFSEITNPIYQINDLLLFLHLKNINHIFTVGCLNFVCTYLIRGILYPHLLFVWYHSYTKNISTRKALNLPKLKKLKIPKMKKQTEVV